MESQTILVGQAGVLLYSNDLQKAEQVVLCSDKVFHITVLRPILLHLHCKEQTSSSPREQIKMEALDCFVELTDPAVMDCYVSFCKTRHRTLPNLLKVKKKIKLS